MRRFLIGIFSTGLFCLMIVTRIIAQPSDPYPPGPVPDRIILTWSEDPASTQSVTWRTDVSVKKAYAEIATAIPTPDFVHYADTVMAKTTLLVTNVNAAHYHSATFRDLQPDKKYIYRVGDGKNFSEWLQFKTAAIDTGRISFLYFGDAQNAIKSMWSRCIREGYSTFPDIDFILHAGDLVNIANNDSEWGEWFYAAGWINGMRSNIVTPGNHEYFRAGNTRFLSHHWQPTFTLPENGPEGVRETAYFTDYQDLRIISLNSMAALLDQSLLEAQAAWLEQVLAANDKTWTIVTQHHPIYSTARKRDNPELRAQWQPLFEKYQVDLVLQGHDHSYGRGRNLNMGGTMQKDAGPVYVVSVSGPKMYLLNFEEWLDRAASNTQLYQLIHIDGNTLKYEAYTAMGTMYDAFSLEKRSDGTNAFTDLSGELGFEILQMPPAWQGRLTPEEFAEYRERFEAYKQKHEKN